MIRENKFVAIWLLVGVFMLLVQIILGGITRLTGSGLSITEWNIVTGFLPPWNEQQWLLEFEKYKQTPQFQFLNFEFSIVDFKFIFFWEWLHRFWARAMGIVFIVPFFVFLFRKNFTASMVKPLLLLFLLGALQGAVGWIMVASGLTGDALYVKPVKLALHFIFAMGLLCYTFWFSLKLLFTQKQGKSSARLQYTILAIVGILVIQFVFGALMAGNKAATAAPTWPDINGYFIPENLQTGWKDFFENKITIHFTHRMLAYLIFASILFWTIFGFTKNENRLIAKARFVPLLLVTTQLGLGIFSLLASPQIIPNNWGLYEWLAQIHQFIALILLLSFVWIFFLNRQGDSKEI